MMEMPDEVREHLEAAFAKAEELGLSPEWHGDGEGFEYDCINCAHAGRGPHRANMRFERVMALPITLLRFEAPSGQRHDSTGGRAHGPAA